MKGAIKFLQYLAAALLALLIFTLVGTIMMRSGVDLVQVDARLQPILDTCRLLHVIAWLLVWARFGAVIDWAIRKGWLEAKDRQLWLALKVKIMAVLAAYIVLVVIGPGRLWGLLVTTFS